MGGWFSYDNIDTYTFDHKEVHFDFEHNMITCDAPNLKVSSKIHKSIDVNELFKYFENNDGNVNVMLYNGYCVGICIGGKNTNQLL